MKKRTLAETIINVMNLLEYNGKGFALCGAFFVKLIIVFILHIRGEAIILLKLNKKGECSGGY